MVKERGLLLCLRARVSDEKLFSGPKTWRTAGHERLRHSTTNGLDKVQEFFTMSTMTVKYLAQLGRERTISPLFERVWTVYGRSNPVAAAMQIVDNQRRGRNRRCLTNAMLFIAIPLCLSVVGVIVYSHDEDNIALFGCLTLAAFLVGAFLEIAAVREVTTAMPDGAVAMIEGFCEHLALVNEWASHYGSTPFYLYHDEDEIKKVGAGILVATATEVLQLQKKEKEAESKESSVARENYQEMAGRVMAAFCKRYDTLKMIGLASGGYDKYFEAARKSLEKEPQTATTA